MSNFVSPSVPVQHHTFNSGFARFQALGLARGEKADADAFSRLDPSTKRMHEFAAQVESRIEDSSPPGVRLARLMEGIDSAIAKLEKKISKLQAQVQDMKQWKLTLAEEMERARNLQVVAAVVKEVVLPLVPHSSPARSEHEETSSKRQQEVRELDEADRSAAKKAHVGKAGPMEEMQENEAQPPSGQGVGEREEAAEPLKKMARCDKNSVAASPLKKRIVGEASSFQNDEVAVSQDVPLAQEEERQEEEQVEAALSNPQPVEAGASQNPIQVEENLPVVVDDSNPNRAPVAPTMTVTLTPEVVSAPSSKSGSKRKCSRCLKEGHTKAQCLMTDKEYEDALVARGENKKARSRPKKEAPGPVVAEEAVAVKQEEEEEEEFAIASAPLGDGDQPLVAVPSKRRRQSGGNNSSGGKNSSGKSSSGKKSGVSTPVSDVFRTSCEVCGKAGLRTKEKLQEHLKTQHVKDEAVCCPIPTCKQLFKNAARVMAHLTMAHHSVTPDPMERIAMSPDADFVIPPGTMLECFECSERFTNAVDLDVHIRRHMIKLYPRDCNLVLGSDGASCNFKAPSQDDMARHIIEAHYELQSECSACGSTELAHECGVRPEQIVGKRVTVRWLRENEIAWYDGEVRRYFPDRDVFEIFYDDGTQVTESLSMRYWRPLERIMTPSKRK